MPEFSKWDSFYLIVGGAAGALIGLQFVALTLIARVNYRPQQEAASAFATPTIMHFCAALMLSAVTRMPWETNIPIAVLWGLMGVSGVIYSIIVFCRMRTTSYQPEFEDWFFHVLIPLTAYATLFVAALTGQAHIHETLFSVGASALLLLVAGIHNSWDAVTYNIFVESQRDKTAADADQAAAQNSSKSKIVENIIENKEKSKNEH